MAKKKLYAGKGATCSILTRFIHPKQHNEDKQHRSKIVLLAKEMKLVNRKQQQCYTFTIVGGDDTVFHAVMKHCVVEKEGKREDFFETPPREKEAANFREPKTKWRKSLAKKLLYDRIMDGTIPLLPEDQTMTLGCH